MTLEEKNEGKKQERSLALNSKISLGIEIVKSEASDNFNDSFLFGITHKGFQDFIKLYYEEINLEYGRTFTKPTLANYTKTAWNTILNNALKTTGDETEGFYPPDENNIAASELNVDCVYINNNGDQGETTGGAIEEINDCTLAIGTTFPLGPNYSDYIYESSVEAENAGDDFVTANKIGVIGARTADAEVSSEANMEEPPYYRYKVGNGTIDNSTYYSNPEKTAMLDSITSLISYLGNVISKVDTIKSELDKIYNENNPTPNELLKQLNPTDNDILDERTAISTYIDTLEGYIGDVGDVIGDGTLYGYYNWFNSAVGNEANFDTYLGNLKTLIDTTIKGVIQTRANSISSILGSNPSGGSPTRLKKWRFFWIKERINKPMASLITLNSMEDAYDKSIINITNTNATLAILFGSSSDDKLKYIPTPTLFAAYYSPKINEETGVVESRRVGLVWDGQIHATKYSIFRQNITFSSIFNNNDNWGIEDKLIDFTTVGENGLVKVEYIDTNVSSNNLYVYRVQSIDEDNDSFISGSLQSKIYKEITYAFTFEEQTLIGTTEVSKVSVADGSLFKTGMYLLENTLGIFYVMKVNDNYIYVYPRLPDDTSNNFYMTYGIVFVS